MAGLPKSMRAVQGMNYGDIDLMLSVKDSVPVPSLKNIPAKERSKHLIIKTHAVALAPGDCRVLSGKTRPMQGPPSFPYVPGGDVCGTVVETPLGCTKFKIGDRVAARFTTDGPIGALGEYAIIDTTVCDKVPKTISSEEAAALASATPAICVADRIENGSRVLILGAGGGVGSHLCQLLRQKSCFVAGVSRNPERLQRAPIKCDAAIDYNKVDPLAKESWKGEPFDVIVDLVGGGWLRLLKNSKVVKPASQGGKYLTTTPDEAIFEIHSMMGAIGVFLLPALRRAIGSRTISRYRLPKYSMVMGLPTERQVMTRILQHAADGTVKGVVDGPYAFTTQEVRQAFRRQESRHPHGKVVVTVHESSNQKASKDRSNEVQEYV